MKKSRKLIWRIFRGFGILLTFLILLAYMTFLMINAKPIKERILALVSPRSNDIIKFQSIAFSLFPTPCVSIFDPTITIPETLTGKMESIRIYPRLMSLLTGKVLISKINIDAPDFIVELSEREAKDNTRASSNMLAEIETSLAPPVAFLQSIAPNLILQVKQGSLVLRNDKRELTTAHNINGKFGLIPNGLNMSVTGDGKRWGHISASGQIIAEENSITFKELSVSANRSSVSGISARFRWETTPFVEVTSGKGVIDLDDLFKRRLLLEGIQGPLQEIKELKGAIRFTEMNFAGHLLHSEEWQMKSVGELEKVVIDSSRLPGRLAIASGLFRTTTKVITLRNLRTTFLGSSLTGSGEITGYFNNIRSAAMSLAGMVGPETIQWASRLYQLSPEWTVRAPIKLSQANLAWQESGNFSMAGTGTIKQGPAVSLDLHHDQNELVIRRFFIEDRESEASLTLRNVKKELDITFSGTLNNNTLKRMFEQNYFHFGWIQGNFKAHLPLDHLRDFNAEGSVEGTDIIIPADQKKPIKVPHLSIKANNQTLSLVAGALSWGEINLALKGDMKVLADHFLLDMDVSSDGMKLDSMPQAQSTEKQRNLGDEMKQVRESLKHFPVQGIIRFTSPYITYGKVTVNSVKTNISLEHDGFRISFLEAKYCGISFPGSLMSTENGVLLNFKPEAINQPLEPALSCLSKADIRMAGAFDLNGDLKTEGKGEPLIDSLQGKVRFTARNGKINRYLLMARILAVLNVTEILKGKLPNLETDGLVYKSITIKGEIQDGKLNIKEATMNGPTLNMAGQGEINLSDRTLNLTVLVAPFKTINDVINNIPLVSKIFGRTLISIPVQVTGNLEDPKVIPLTPLAIGEDVLDIMKRSLELPFKVIEGIIPDKTGTPR